QLAERTRAFAGRERVLAQLMDHALATSNSRWGLHLRGEAGSGKSALLARLVSELRSRPALVLYHSAGLTPRSTSVDSMLRDWIHQMCRWSGTDDRSDDPHLDVDLVFEEQLGTAAARAKVLCVVD